MSITDNTSAEISDIKVGGIYRHYKGSLYCVISTAEHTETGEGLVVYQSAAGVAAGVAVGGAISDASSDTYTANKKVWARPLAMWVDEVMVEGVLQPRFQYLASSMKALDRKRLFRIIELAKDSMEQYQRLVEHNTLRFYHKPTGDILEVEESILGLIEEDEATDGCTDEHVANAEKILASRKDYLCLPTDEVSQYEQILQFINDLPVAYHGDLLRSIQGRGAFRRFKETATRLGVIKGWFRFLDAAYRKEARLWCERNGIEWWRDML